MRTLILTVSLFAPPALANEVIHCPETYPSSDTVVATSAYWTHTVVLGNQALTSAGMLEGPLHLRADLRGEETKTADGYQVRYRFDRNQRRPEKWVQCSYGDGGSIRLVRRVNDGIMECTLTYKRAKSPRSPIITVMCR